MKIGLNNFTVELYDHQIEWEQNAKETIKHLKEKLGDLIVDIEHIGSTSIKTIKAKPIIDLVVGIKDFSILNDIMEKLQNNGFVYCPKNDSPESRMFVIGDLNGIITHIIHVVEYNGNEWNNKINFRDYMNNNIEKAKEYENLKITAMKGNENNVPDYHKKKEEFILEKIKEANNWRKVMEKNCLINYLEKRFDVYFDIFEDIINVCPDDIWNKKYSGYVFWHQILHAFTGTFLWLRDEKIVFSDAIGKIGALNIKWDATELDVDPSEATKELYTKNDVLKICTETKKQYKEWFRDKNDNWLTEPFKMNEKVTNFDTTIRQIEHLMYHIGHCEAIFRENNIKIKKYLDEG